MSANHAAEGTLLLIVTVVFLVTKYFRARKSRQLPAWGWAGLAVILVAELLLFLRTSSITTFFTPIAWTGYLLLIDGAVWSLRGQSRLASEPKHFFSLACWSVPLWLLFEAYNLRLENWTYAGLPENFAVRSVGYAWSFATIWPAIFETADFLQALGLFRTQDKPRAPWGRTTLLGASFLGLLLASVPILVPAAIGQYLFGAVWVGFVLLLDPINYAWKGRSFRREWEAGETSLLYSFLASGLVCGILWEFWNYWAGAKWLYVFPIFQNAKIFEMPLLGYLGFAPFALECFVMYEFLRNVKKRFLRLQRSPAWGATEPQA